MEFVHGQHSIINKQVRRRVAPFSEKDKLQNLFLQSQNCRKTTKTTTSVYQNFLLNNGFFVTIVLPQKLFTRNIMTQFRYNATLLSESLPY